MSAGKEDAVEGMDPETRKKVDRYLDEVGRSLWSVERVERQAILCEIRTAIVEKLSIEGDASKGKIGTASVQKVLEDFGPPSEVAREYAGVAAPAPGRGVKLFFAFLAVWSIVLGIIGIAIIWNYFGALGRGWEPWPSQFLTGLFWVTVMATVLVSIVIQLRRQASVSRLGPFTALAFMIPALWGVSSLAWNDDISWVLPMVPAELKMPVTIVIGLAVMLPTMAGLWLLLKLKDREKAREGTMEKIVPGMHPRSERKWMGAATFAIVTMFIVANGTWWYYEATAPAGPREGDQHFIGSEFVGGQYNASIEHWTGYSNGNWWDYYKIVYTYNGTTINGSFQLEMRPALDWIKGNTSSNDTVVSWWDYGHAIRGYTGRDAAIYMTSKNFINTIADRNKEGRPWESEEKVRAVSNILLAQNESQLRQGMEGFGAKYILTTQRDSSGIAYAILEGAGKNPDDYLRTVNGIYIPKDAAQDMLLFKLWSGGDFNGTTIVYKDINTMIVELS